VLRGRGTVVRQEPSAGAPLPAKGSSVVFELGLFEDERFEDDTGSGG
jgi:hypothetical protein